MLGCEYVGQAFMHTNAKLLGIEMPTFGGKK
jgi:hypothetical protein